MDNWQVGDIIQITDESHPWYPCLLIVTEPKTWGVQACCLWPESNAERKIAHGYNRLKNEQIVICGKAHVIPE